MEKKPDTFVCKGCSKENKIVLSSDQEKAFCYNCGALLFSRGIAQRSKAPTNLGSSQAKRSKTNSSTVGAGKKKIKIPVGVWIVGGLFSVITLLVIFAGSGYSFTNTQTSRAIMFVLATGVGVLLLFGVLFVLVESFTKKCEKCNNSNVTKTVSDNPEGTTTMLRSSNVWGNKPDGQFGVVDRQYYDDLVEYGIRTTRVKCNNCGHSKVERSEYQKSRLR